MIRIRDFLEFILKHRGKTLLIGWNESEILNAIRKALHEKTFYYVKNEKNEITCVCIAEITDKNFHIIALLTLYSGQLRDCFEYFNKNYEGYELKGYRRGKLVKFKGQKRYE